MSRFDIHRVLSRQFDESLIGTRISHKAWTGRLAESEAELDTGYRIHKGLVNIFNRFDKVRLTEYEIVLVWIIDDDRF